jgi:hypothetical protein
VGREGIFNPTVGNESLHQDSNVDGVRIVSFVTGKNKLLRARYFHTETYINTPQLLLMGRLTNRLITY